MKPGRHAAADGSFGRSAGGAMLRGVTLIAVAVILGIILLRATEGPDGLVGTPDRPGATVPTTSPGAGQQTASTPTTIAPIDPSTITVLVANGS